MDPIAHLLALEHLGIKFGLENIRTITAALGRPQDSYRSLIVAGTNGKGSVSAMLDAALRASGLRTACYTSPHLVRIEERFAVDGEPVSSEAFRDAASDVLDLVARLRAQAALEVEPTFFEVTTAIGFELFRRAGVEIAVLEVGMGGRFDATNVASPMAGAITTIDLDHEKFLGHTIREIAFEKAGVIKPGMTIVTGERKAEALAVIAQAAAERGARLVMAGEGVRVSARIDRGRTLADIQTPVGRYGEVALGLRGRHQVENAVVAIRLLESLASHGLRVPPDAIAGGLAATRWPGRLDLVDLGGGREVLFDSAHNPAGASVLAAYLDEVYPAGLPLVFGVMRDKDATGMLRLLLPRATAVCFTAPDTPRAMPPDALAELARQVGWRRTIDVEPSPRRALARAIANSPVVLVAGSIFLIGELLPVAGFVQSR